ncbi:16S rRNA (cytosine(967)-C(5))-methyltransferase RsmB [Rhodanobacter sp. A1T4]|uniref:16S rRNA (cytosine(967)-C(5))-methyltransferase RsmB n=1 Tax=Rhodanobacter sp. A1T4 TaxID=2723087 RepID=UPI001615F94B|nr:16S rRNA (cytosine(967)-C(5))-methyltransferase RsmB [Rhodanobacter sp. A1T4]MBB6248913.1 16S rRNA (cytosine967-C5)-methyltransferase [Rhodanobacter sp. A1T4]
MTVDTRALAARSLAEITMRGASLREVMERNAPKLRDPRDRALLMALLSEGARWWLRFDAAIDHLLEKSLRHKDPAIHALLVLGLVQLEILQLQDYAAVAATVEATRTLKRPQLAGLVNAVLRRWQRERENLIARLDAKPQTRHAHPEWLAKALASDWPAQADAVMAADNREPPLMLRVNRQHIERAALLAQFQAAGYEASLHPWLTDALVLPHSADITRMPGFEDGAFAVQDGAAQVAADLADLKHGMRVLDACAAPGGKACHLLERARIDLTALEVDAKRGERIRQNLMRLRLDAKIVIGDAGAPAGWWKRQPFDRILIDAPCSATGVLRRRPDVRLHRRESDIAAMHEQQRRILSALWPLLAPGGRLIYITCSVLRAENEVIVSDLLAQQGDARVVPFTLPVGHAAKVGWQILPGDGDLDGMYYAVLEKQAVPQD